MLIDIGDEDPFVCTLHGVNYNTVQVLWRVAGDRKPPS